MMAVGTELALSSGTESAWRFIKSSILCRRYTAKTPTGKGKHIELF
jgi:hypothetical protein